MCRQPGRERPQCAAQAFTSHVQQAPGQRTGARGSSRSAGRGSRQRTCGGATTRAFRPRHSLVATARPPPPWAQRSGSRHARVPVHTPRWAARAGERGRRVQPGQSTAEGQQQPTERQRAPRRCGCLQVAAGARAGESGALGGAGALRTAKVHPAGRAHRPPRRQACGRSASGVCTLRKPLAASGAGGAGVPVTACHMAAAGTSTRTHDVESRGGPAPPAEAGRCVTGLRPGQRCGGAKGLCLRKHGRRRPGAPAVLPSSGCRQQRAEPQCSMGAVGQGQGGGGH